MYSSLIYCEFCNKNKQRKILAITIILLFLRTLINHYIKKINNESKRNSIY